MIKLIGFKRLLILAIVLGINLVGAMGYFGILQPMREEAETQLNSVNAQVADLQMKIANIQNDILYFKENLPKYEALKERGFFQDQDRFMISRILEDLQKKTKLSNFAFDVGGIEEVPNNEAIAMEHRLVSSRIRVERIASLLDTDVYVFMQEIANAFPEHVRIHGFDIRRSAEVTEDSLRKIVAKQTVSFVDGAVTFEWLTLVPKVVEAPVAPGAAPAGFRGR